MTTPFVALASPFYTLDSHTGRWAGVGQFCPKFESGQKLVDVD